MPTSTQPSHQLRITATAPVSGDGLAQAKTVAAMDPGITALQEAARAAGLELTVETRVVRPGTGGGRKKAGVAAGGEG